MAPRKGVLFVCLGNICRSPIAEAIFLDLINQREIRNNFFVDSAGLGGWHVGNFADERAIATLKKHDIEYRSCARQIEDEDFNKYDYIFGMDQDNIEKLKREAPENCKAKILLLGDFDPEGDRIIRDPYNDKGDEGFETCYQQCLRACTAFLDKLQKGEEI